MRLINETRQGMKPSRGKTKNPLIQFSTLSTTDKIENHETSWLRTILGFLQGFYCTQHRVQNGTI